MKFISIFRVRGIRLRISLLLYALGCQSIAQSKVELPRCEALKAGVSEAQEYVKERTHFKGVWVSEKCEIRPGPRFLLRRYAFHSDYSFRLVRFHYSDPHCSIPLYSVTAVGRFEPFSAKNSASWVVPGGLEPNHILKKISIVPFSEDAVKMVSELVNKSCPGYVKRKWKPYKKYKLMYYDELLIKKQEPQGGTDNHYYNLDCTHVFNIHFNELNLLRAEDQKLIKSHYLSSHIKSHRQLREGHKLKIRTSRLYLGADAEDSNMKPTFYQSPLVLAKTMTNCRVCQVVGKATDISAPRVVSEKFWPMDILEGEWTSLACEVRPYGLFLKRHFFFESPNGHWSAEHEYFRDHNCRKPMFELRASGQYFRGRVSAAVPGATDYDFRISEASLTPQDIHFVNNLNSGGCAPSKVKWHLNMTFDLSIFGGCEALGIWIPSVELDLVLAEESDDGGTLLYLGQAMDNEKRPTSFQPPLAPCWSISQQNKIDNALYPLPQVQINSSSVNKPLQRFIFTLTSIIIIILLNSKKLF